MRRPRGIAMCVSAVTLVVLALAPAVATAGSVQDQRNEVERIADELDALADKIGQLDEDYGAALDRKDTLDGEIVVLQGKVDEQSSLLADLEQALSEMAVDRYISGGGVQLSPLFSNAESYSDEQQRTALSGVVAEVGTVDADEMSALYDELTAQRDSLNAKRAEVDELIAFLSAKMAEATQLEDEYQQKQAAAEAKLGELIVQEQERRLAQQIEEAQRREREQALNDDSNSNSGGNNSGGNTSGGNTSGGGGNSGGNSGGGGGSGGGNPQPPSPTPNPPKPDPTPAPPPPSSKAGVAVNAAMGQQGVPYRFAAEEPGVAFDCSGLTKYAWGRAGVYLPHQSRAQYASTPRVPKDAVQPGDLIFYYSPIGHVGIYVGGGAMIHAPRTGDVVKVSNVNWGKVVGVSRPG